MRHRQAVTTALILISFLGIPATANVTWTWCFANERGWFETDGDFIGATAPARNYTFDTTTFKVISSAVNGLIGSGYTVLREPQGFLWDGAKPTLFWRSGSGGTDSSCFEKDIDQSPYLYIFDTDNDPQGSLLDPDSMSTIYTQGMLILKPEKSIQSVPAPEAFFLACLGAGVIIWMRRESKL